MPVPEAPPSYSGFTETSDELPFIPAYSEHAGDLERVLCTTLPHEHLHRVASYDSDFIFKSDHMEVNLGPRVWGLRMPAYGLHGNVHGHVKFTEEQARVVKVTATLKGCVTTTATERGVVTAQLKIPLVHETVILYSPSLREDYRWENEHTFSIPFPPAVSTRQGSSPLPPSWFTYFPGAFCEVRYSLKLDMTRKGLRRHDSMTIPISYLPKSRPAGRPLLEIHRPTEYLASRPYPLDHRVRTMKLPPIWPRIQGKQCFAPVDKSMSLYLSLPSSKEFTSGEQIPVMLSLVCRETPVVIALLAPKIQLELVKRTTLWSNIGHEVGVRNVVLSTANIIRIDDSTEGVHRLICVLHAGLAGQQSSWGIGGVVQVEFFIRVVLTPPCSMSEVVPQFRHHEPVQITTDPWGTQERELISTGGLPPPALGLASIQREPTRCLPQRGATL